MVNFGLILLESGYRVRLKGVQVPWLEGGTIKGGRLPVKLSQDFLEQAAQKF